MSDSEPEGATPVDADEAADLLPSHIHTRDELNLWEQQNILGAASWALSVSASVLSEPMVRELHRRMFDRTWAWAGRYRTSDKNIAVYWATVSVEVRKVMDDGLFWMERGTFTVDEATLRLHHRLVKVHPFPNGNGRHARLWCDTLLRQEGRPPFAWRSRELDQVGEARHAYVRALQAADAGDYRPLFTLYLSRRPPA